MSSFVDTLTNEDDANTLQNIDIISAQKELVRCGYPALPESFLAYLQKCNGMTQTDSAILGIPPLVDGRLDIIEFNRLFNTTSEMVIIGYDEFGFLVYNAPQNKYLLIDRDSGMVLEEYPEQDIDYALNSILHINDE